MARSLWDPEIFGQVISKKKQQLAEIESKLHGLPLDDPSRSKLLEDMSHLQRTIPAIEAEYAKKTAVEPDNSAADLAAHGGMELRPVADDHPLSLTQCSVCTHFECYHDEEGCFLDPNGKRSQEPGILNRAALKAFGSECWCPQFLSDPKEAIDLIFRLGSSQALKKGVVEALNRGDTHGT